MHELRVSSRLPGHLAYISRYILKHICSLHWAMAGPEATWHMTPFNSIYLLETKGRHRRRAMSRILLLAWLVPKQKLWLHARMFGGILGDTGVPSQALTSRPGILIQQYSAASRPVCSVGDWAKLTNLPFLSMCGIWCRICISHFHNNSKHRIGNISI